LKEKKEERKRSVEVERTKKSVQGTPCLFGYNLHSTEWDKECGCKGKYSFDLLRNTSAEGYRMF